MKQRIGYLCGVGLFFLVSYRNVPIVTTYPEIEKIHTNKRNIKDRFKKFKR